MLKSITACFKSFPEGWRLRHQRNLGIFGSCKRLQLGHLVDGQARRINSVPWFFTITPLSGTIASWGFAVNFHHFEQEINLVGEKLWNKQNNQTRIATKLGLSLCTVTNVHHCFELFCPMRNYLYFCFFAFVFRWNQTCCLSRVCCTCDFWRRGNWRTKDASSANRSRSGRHDWKRINVTTTSTFFTSPFFQPPL